MDKQTELGAYILALCNAQNLSLRAASLRSGLKEGTISKILQRDGRSVPVPDTLAKIASGLGGDYIRMMRLAGHLPPGGDGDMDLLSMEIRSKLDRLVLLSRRAAEKDPQRAADLLNMFTTSVEIMLQLQEAAGGTEEAEEETVRDGRIPD